MSTYRQIIYQVVFATKGHKRVLVKDQRDRLWAYMAEILRNHQCHVYKVNGVEDHVHLLFELHPTVALARLVKDVKLASNQFIQQELNMPLFSGWQAGYGAFTYDNTALPNLIQYVESQEEHHMRQTFEEEFRKL